MKVNLMAIDPIAFKLGPIPVNWYGLIIVTGMILAIFLGIREGEKEGFPKTLLWIQPFGRSQWELSELVCITCFLNWNFI